MALEVVSQSLLRDSPNTFDYEVAALIVVFKACFWEFQLQVDLKLFEAVEL